MDYNSKWFSIHVGTFDDLLLALVEVGTILAIVDRNEKIRSGYYFPPSSKKRKYFSETTKKLTKIRQLFKCKVCKKRPELWEFHHMDCDRSNNSLENCEGLCPNCHAKKTRRKD